MITDAQVKEAELAIDRETMRQYEENKGWEEAKDVIENLDCKSIAIEAIRAADAAAWRPIEEAPSDDLILCIATEGTQSILLGRTAIKWKYASFRHLPTPPKEPPK